MTATISVIAAGSLCPHWREGRDITNCTECRARVYAEERARTRRWRRQVETAALWREAVGLWGVEGLADLGIVGDDSGVLKRYE